MTANEPTGSTDPTDKPRSAAASRSPRGVAYRREVTSEHVGQRVSIRWRDGHGDVRDVVGRLAAFDEELAIVTDRHANLHTVPTSQMVASKIIPVHPRRPAEPVVGIPSAPVVRHAARIVLIDKAQVVLVAHHPTPATTVWTAPGGGILPGESAHDAARREAAEELQIDVNVGPLVLRRSETFPFRGVWITQHEQWFLAEPAPPEPAVTTQPAPDQDPSADQAHLPLSVARRSPDAATSRIRWWSVDELSAPATTRVEPPELGTIVAHLVTEGVPAQPWDLGHRHSD